MRRTLRTSDTQTLQKKCLNTPAALLGIESGGTRTTALLAPAGGETCLRAEFGPANLRLLDDEALVDHFKTIATLSAKSNEALGGIAIGMAGARSEPDRQRIRDAAGKIWPGVPCYATNDLETALAAGAAQSKKQPAAQVLVLSGTGSCCFGRAADGKTARVGGWGHIIGDKGSGYEIGLRGIKAAVFHLDRDGKWSPLGQNILAALLLNEPEELIDWAKNASKPEIAILAIQVFNAAAKRDKIALDILEGAASSLARDGASCAKKLVKAGAAVQFVLAGSVLLQQPAFAKKVASEIRKLWPKALVTPLERDSAWGALELARAHFASGAKIPTISRETGYDSGLVPKSRGLSPTEERNPRSLKLDQLSIQKAVDLMIDEESRINQALFEERKNIAKAVTIIVTALKNGGRLFYTGAGTSGRLGVLDASECPPTFRVPPELVQGIIAGGQTALWRSVEGAEDSVESGAAAVLYRGITSRDVLIGIAASGRTPFVWGGIDAAKKRGARTMLVCFNPNLDIPKAIRPDIVIAPNVGPEILTGSTRLKSGTATKVLLNMLTTLAMVQLGKVMSNLMVDLNASNKKLRERAIRIVQAVTGADADAAHAALEKNKWIVKTACQQLR